MVTFHVPDKVVLEWCGILTMLALIQQFVEIIFASFHVVIIILVGKELITMIALL